MRSAIRRQGHYRCLVHQHVSYPRTRTSHVWQPPPNLPGFPYILQSRAFRSIGNTLRSDPSFLSSELDTGFSPPDRSEAAILERAKVHGIETLNDLSFQADLGRSGGSAKRLIDDHSIRQDLDLWSILLDYRQVKDGPNGVRVILEAMLYGGEPVRLHADSVSEHIWRTLLPVVLADDKLFYKLCHVGSSLMRDRQRVFADVVGQLLVQGNLRLAVIASTQYLGSYFRGYIDLIHVFEITIRLGTDEALNNFAQLVARLPRCGIYSETVPKLWKLERNKQAFRLHKFLLSIDEYPTAFDQIEPLIQELAVKDVKLEPFIRQLENHGIWYSHQARRVYQQERLFFHQKSDKRTEVKFRSPPGTRPVKLSDTFVARTFATRSVSFDFVLSGLQFVGLFEIGPLALREIALSAKDTHELRRRFQQLDKMKVDIGASNYVRTLKNLCMTDQHALLESIVVKDMHYEVFDDVGKQKRLLTQYYHERNWTELNRTLSILNGGKISSEASSRSARLILQAALIEGDWREALAGVDDLRMVNLESRSRSKLAPLRSAIQRIWTNVALRERSNTDYIRHHSYLAGLLQHAQSAGLEIPPWQWRSTLHAVGRSGDWSMFRQLLLSLGRITQMSISKSVNDHKEGVEAGKIVYQSLLNDSMQVLVIEISLTAHASTRDPQKLWSRALHLLKTAAKRFRVKIDYHCLNAAFRSRLEQLFAGVDIGGRRDLIDHYISCLKWAWLEAGLSHDEEPASASQSHGVSTPDVRSLELLQRRLKVVPERRNAVEPYLIDRVRPRFSERAEPKFVEDKSADPQLSSETDPLHYDFWEVLERETKDSSVFYEDLLHPSYKQG